MRWNGQELGTADADALPGLEHLSGLVRSVTTPEFSGMTFHEVRDVVDKTVSLREAVSHLAPGGKFVFVDLFGDRGFYPDDAAIERALTDSGGHIEERRPLDALLPLPFPLRHKRVLGGAQLIAGARKN